MQAGTMNNTKTSEGFRGRSDIKAANTDVRKQEEAARCRLAEQNQSRDKRFGLLVAHEMEQYSICQIHTPGR